MARIRSIKPEFPHSESMGRVSRDARLCFILLWTLADDDGRLRGDSRLLASLLYPYDDDARDLLPAWLSELQNAGCIDPYQCDGQSYIQVINWRAHQRIDKPTPSKIPEIREDSWRPREDSRGFARPLLPPQEDSLRKGGEGKGMEGSGDVQKMDDPIDEQEQLIKAVIHTVKSEKPKEEIVCHWWQGSDSWACELIETVRAAKGYANFAPTASECNKLLDYVRQFCPDREEFSLVLASFAEKANNRRSKTPEYSNPILALRKWFGMREEQWRKVSRQRQIDGKNGQTVSGKEPTGTMTDQILIHGPNGPITHKFERPIVDDPGPLREAERQRVKAERGWL